MNTYFRYTSAGFINSDDVTQSWVGANYWNWAKQSGVVQPVKDQGTCSTCWVFAPVAATESAYFIANAKRAIVGKISEQQVLDCNGLNLTCLSGGWPTDTLNFASTKGLLFSSDYNPLKNCVSQVASSVRISAYEQVNVNDWVGLWLALQQLPVVVNIEGSADSFVNYNGTYIYNDEDCFSNGLDHSVLLVGYDLTNAVPHWIIRNSWGTTWGDKGYMRIKIATGDGICGINTQPGLIPVFNFPDSDPCNRNNYAVANGNTEIGLGSMNPCGGGRCIPYGNSYHCNCSKPVFVPVLNSDNTETCAPASPCSFYTANPCEMGTCLDSAAAPGTYTCLCPIGYALDPADNASCIPAAALTGLKSFVVPPGYNLSCSVIYNVYGLDADTFMRQNPKIDCRAMVPPSSVLNITNSQNCSLVYAAEKNDSCDSIEERFNLSSPLDGPGSPNPGLNCSLIEPYQQICLQRGPLLYLGPCTLFHGVAEGETCADIITTYLDGNATLFYALNPGIYCGRIEFDVSAKSFGQKVCLEAGPLGGAMAGCQGVPRQLTAQDSCASLKKCFTKRLTFKKMNRTACSAKLLRKLLGAGPAQLCVPQGSAC